MQTPSGAMQTPSGATQTPSGATQTPKLPSTNRQRAYICDNEQYLNASAKLSILALVTHYVNDQKEEGNDRTDVFVSPEEAKDTHIDLDKIDSSDLIRQIYGIVRRQVELLDEPVQGHNYTAPNSGPS